MRTRTPLVSILCTAALAGCLSADVEELGVDQAELTLPPIDLVERPRITGFSPWSARPGETVTIRGEHFNRTAAGHYWHPRLGYPWEVRLGSRTIAAFQLVSPTELRFTVPSGPSGGYISLVEGGATIARSPTRFLTAPSNLTATTTSVSSLRLAWSDNANDETAYEIWIADPAWRSLGTVLPRTGEPITNLPPQTTWPFRVRARRNQEVSAWSNAVKGSTGGLPAITFSQGILSPFVDGPAAITRDAQSGEALIYGIYDTNGDGVVAGAPGLHADPASLYPRWRGYDCGVYAGARFAPGTNLILLAQVETGGNLQFVAVHAALQPDGTITAATFAGGDLGGAGGLVMGATQQPAFSLAVTNGIADGTLQGNLFASSCIGGTVSGVAVSIDLADGIPVYNE